MEKTQQINQLPPEGLSRWRQIKPFVNLSQECWRIKGLAGTAPQPIRVGIRCTFYQNSEVLKFLADPINYRAPQNDKTPSSLKTGG